MTPKLLFTQMVDYQYIKDDAMLFKCNTEQECPPFLKTEHQSLIVPTEILDECHVTAGNKHIYCTDVLLLRANSSHFSDHGKPTSHQYPTNDVALFINRFFLKKPLGKQCQSFVLIETDYPLLPVAFGAISLSEYCLDGDSNNQVNLLLNLNHIICNDDEGILFGIAMVKMIALMTANYIQDQNRHSTEWVNVKNVSIEISHNGSKELGVFAHMLQQSITSSVTSRTHLNLTCPPPHLIP